MIDPDLEVLVACYLERAACDADLTPRSFAREHPERATELVEAIESAIDVERLFDADLSAAPERIGEYVVVREIGRGGMGVVYEVSRDGRHYALKLLLRAPLLGARGEARFRRESRSLALVHHPNVVRIVDDGSDHGVPYVVMELVEGEPLDRLAGRLSDDEAIRLVKRLALAVQAAHVRGVLHRDIKPQNVIVRPDREPVLVDFGLVSVAGLSSLTGSGDVLGTPRYMAPEQLEGTGVDERADVFALGLVLYELVTGKPGREVRPSTGARQTDATPIKSPRRRRPDLPRDLDRLLRATLAHEPRYRPPSAAAFAEELDRILAGEPVVSRPPGALTRVAARLAPHRVLAGAVVLGVMAVAALVVAFVRPADVADVADLADVAAARDQLDRAVMLWSEGRGEEAAPLVVAALDVLPFDPSARALCAHLASTPSPVDPPASVLFAGLRAPEGGGDERLLEDLVGVSRGSDSPLSAVLAGRLARRLRRDEVARQQLGVAAQLLPGSARLAGELGDVCLDLDLLAEAEREHARVVAIAPLDPSGWRDYARTLTRRNRVSDALVAAERARELASSSDPELDVVLAEALDRDARHDEARALLAGALKSSPGFVPAWLALAVSYDTTHEIAEALRYYDEVVRARPDDAFALALFANLRAGAEYGSCRGCTEAFDRHPEVRDQKQASQLFVRAVRADAGRSKSLMRLLATVLLRISDRTEIAAALEELIASGGHTRAASRLKELLRILRIREGG